MKVKISDYIAKLAAELGIEYVFTVTGGGAMHLNDSFGHSSSLKCIYNHHEQACAIGAESYARIAGKPALLCVTTGPGGTNALTGVLGAYLDSIPMVVISGQVRFDTTARSTGLNIRAMGDQEFDITRAVASMTKYCEMVTEPKMAAYALKKAYHIATTGRPGPCWLDIPLNVQGAYVDTEELIDYSRNSEEYEAYTATLPPKPSREMVMHIIHKIKKSKRPVFNVGNGIRIAGAAKVFERVKKLLNIPVVTGWNSIDLCADDEELYVGRAGIMGDRPGNFAVQNSDLFLSIGSRLSIRQVGYNYKSWAREAYTIVEDVDSEELKKPDIHVDMPVWADALDLLTLMEECLKDEVNEEGVLFPHTDWHDTCLSWKRDYPVVQEKHYAECLEDGHSYANVYAFIKELSLRLKPGQVTVVGNGSACVVGSHAYVIKENQRFIINSAVASMGYDLPAAIGAWIAENSSNSHRKCDIIKGNVQDIMSASELEQAQLVHSERRMSITNEIRDIICITGDGSIQMNLQELQTIIHHRMNIKIFVINNGGYHSIRQTQKNFFEEPLVGIGEDSGDLSFPDMAKLAWAYGYEYRKICSNKQYDVFDEVLSLEEPVICEVFVTRGQNFEPKSATKRLEDGSMVSAPLEDLAPFLPKEELDRIMIIPPYDGR